MVESAPNMGQKARACTAKLSTSFFDQSTRRKFRSCQGRSLEFSTLAKYAFGLAQLFNAFYRGYPILNEEDPGRKRWRAAGVAYVRAQLTRTLDLMGIEVPVRM